MQTSPARRSRFAGAPLLAAALILSTGQGAAAPHDEFKVKSEQVFEFVQKPVVTREGDRVTITFEAKGFCDVTVAIEEFRGQDAGDRDTTGTSKANEGGASGEAHATRHPVPGRPRILRHLASGVLGPNAPEPFQKNSRKQSIIWDGKDDQGAYIDDKQEVAVRVSLGLKPRFERTLVWSPHRRTSGEVPPLIRATPDGVLVFDRTLRLFDHEGNYVRTLYPFPAERLDAVLGLERAVFPQDGESLPVKHGTWLNTLLTTGANGVSGIAVHDRRVYLLGERLNRLAWDGSSGGVAFNGPDIGVFQEAADGNRIAYSPWSAALSPDGKWLYLAGYARRDPPSSQRGQTELHGVRRLGIDGSGAPGDFAGEMTKPGDDEAHFKYPSSVDCDADGRVYVADYMNNRIQVFSPDGKLLKTLPVSRPFKVQVHRRNGELYVFSWAVACRVYYDESRTKTIAPVPAVLTRYRPIDWTRPPQEQTLEKIAAYPFPLRRYSDQPGVYHYACWGGLQYEAELDSWTDPPRIWLVPGQVDLSPYGEGVTQAMAHIKILTVDDRNLTVTHDFADQARKAAFRLEPPKHDRQRLYVNPTDGVLYVGEHKHYTAMASKAFDDLLRIDPESGRVTLVRLAFDSEDMAFDPDGYAYLRTENLVVRYDTRYQPWREVPFDYGEERQGVGFCNNTGGTVASGIPLPSVKPGCFHMGGMAVSPKGTVAVTCHNPERETDRREAPSVTGAVSKRGYVPRLYPGRARGWEIHVFDKHGRLRREDAVPGVGFTHGIGIDKDDHLYLLLAGQRILDGKPYFSPGSCTLFKVKAGQSKVLSTGPGVKIPLAKEAEPDRPHDIAGQWIENAQWFYGGAGFRGTSWCSCQNVRPALDLFARSFTPEVEHYSVAVLDTNGNLVLRVGQYGNVDDGVPMSGQPSAVSDRPDTRHLTPGTRSIGGDEVALFHACYLGTHSDRRLFIADAGNARILSVKLDYHATERVALKDVPDQGRKASDRPSGKD